MFHDYGRTNDAKECSPKDPPTFLFSKECPVHISWHAKCQVDSRDIVGELCDMTVQGPRHCMDKLGIHGLSGRNPQVVLALTQRLDPALSLYDFDLTTRRS